MVKLPLAFHCADVYDMYCHVIGQILPEKKDAIIASVRSILADRYGEDFLPVLDEYQNRNFEEI